MKKLDRPASPDCLSKHSYKHGKWSDLTPYEKEAVWKKLKVMQGGFCAYCECILYKKHIDYFRSQSRHPKLTFDWDNLFGSCGDHTANRNRCGQHKDSNKVGYYNYDDLIKPDVDYADNYFAYLIDGTVRGKTNLTEREAHKAKETIRVFNLNEPALQNSRRSIIKADHNNIKELYKLENDLSLEEWQEFFDSELDRISGSEYQSALIYAWTFRLKY